MPQFRKKASSWSAHASKQKPHLWCKKLQRQLAPEEVLGTPEGVATFAKWAPATGQFNWRYRTFGTTGEGEEEIMGNGRNGTLATH